METTGNQFHVEESGSADVEGLKDPVSKLLMPPASLANCVFGVLMRDTRGCGLDHEQRFNHFPASPLCCISWIFDGDCHLIRSPQQMTEPELTPPVPKIFVSGPMKYPQTSWNPGDTNAMTIAFYPEAFVALSNIVIADIIDQYIPANEVLQGDFLALVENINNSSDVEISVQRLMTKLEPWWASKRPNTIPFGPLVSDWVTSVATRAMVSSTGKSVRQVERRLKSWTGRSYRSIKAYAQADRTYKNALIAKSNGSLGLADISAQSGFADQSHMSRHVRQQTGYSPADLMKRIETEEAFWCFRLLGERY